MSGIPGWAWRTTGHGAVLHPRTIRGLDLGRQSRLLQFCRCGQKYLVCRMQQPSIVSSNVILDLAYTAQSSGSCSNNQVSQYSGRRVSQLLLKHLSLTQHFITLVAFPNLLHWRNVLYLSINAMRPSVCHTKLLRGSNAALWACGPKTDSEQHLSIIWLAWLPAASLNMMAPWSLLQHHQAQVQFSLLVSTSRVSLTFRDAGRTRKGFITSWFW